MDFRKREHLLVLAALICLGAWAGDKLVRAPMQKTWNKWDQRITETGKSLAKGHVMVDREDDIRKQWSEMKRRGLPADQSVAENSVLQSLSRWSQQGRLGVTSIKPRWSQDEEDHMKIECRAATQGNVGAVARFLYELERDPLALRVETVEITGRDDSGRDLTLDVQYTGLLLTDKTR